MQRRCGVGTLEAWFNPNPVPVAFPRRAEVRFIVRLEQALGSVLRLLLQLSNLTLDLALVLFADGLRFPLSLALLLGLG